MGQEILGRRIVAALLDSFIISGVWVLTATLSGGARNEDGTVSVNTGTGGTLAVLGIALAYFILSEGSGGQTLAKRALGLKVVGPGGAEPTLRQSVTRNLLRVVDGLPMLYLVGFVTIVAGGRGQRLGDIAAQTNVVRVGR